LSRYNPGAICFLCQKKESEKLPTDDSPTYDVNDMARILRVESEQVRRLARKGKLPQRIPGIRKCVWSKALVHRWMESEGQLTEGSTEQLAALGDAHGGWHFDEASGQWKLGDPEVVSPIVSDHSGSKTVIYTEFKVEHSESG